MTAFLQGMANRVVTNSAETAQRGQWSCHGVRGDGTVPREGVLEEMPSELNFMLETANI